MGGWGFTTIYLNFQLIVPALAIYNYTYSTADLLLEGKPPLSLA